MNVLESWENLSMVINGMESDAEQLPVLMEIALYSDDKKSWRAAWVAEKIHDAHPLLIFPYLEKMIGQLKKETNSSKKRHFLKIISQNEIPEKHYSFLIDFCLNGYSSAAEPVAIRVHALQILFNISEKIPEFKSELLAVLEHDTDIHPQAGIQARRKKLTEILKKQLRKNQAPGAGNFRP